METISQQITKKNLALTSLILNADIKSFYNWKHYLPSVISAGFSVFFSISIVLELKTIITGIELIVFGLFILFFLIYNEKTKFKELNAYFRGEKYNRYLLFFTFFLSITLSGIGIFLWTNKSTELKNNDRTMQETEIAGINQKYYKLISEIENKDINKYSEYNNEYGNLVSWKKKRAIDTEERKQITTNIQSTQNNLLAITKDFNNRNLKEVKSLNELKQQEINLINTKFNSKQFGNKKTEFISYVFLLLTLIVEYATLGFSKDLSKLQGIKTDFINDVNSVKFRNYYKILFSLYTTKKVESILEINDIKYSCIAMDWEEVKKLFNLLDTLEIIRIERHKSDLRRVKGRIAMTETQALETLQKYFERIIA